MARSLRRTKVKKICSGNHCLTFDFLIADDASVIVTVATDLSRVVPLKKQQGFLGMVSQILDKLGNLARSFLPSILQIILSLLSTCVFALEHREKVCCLQRVMETLCSF